MKAILWLLLFLMWTSDVRAQSPFYAGKTITVVAGVSAGSAYDLYARLMAQHMGKHIPGIGMNQNYELNSVPQLGDVRAALRELATDPA